jgi:hypothetical protein
LIETGGSSDARCKAALRAQGGIFAAAIRWPLCRALWPSLAPTIPLANSNLQFTFQQDLKTAMVREASSKQTINVFFQP